jgi:hypothetical protein
MTFVENILESIRCVVVSALVVSGCTTVVIRIRHWHVWPIPRSNETDTSLCNPILAEQGTGQIVPVKRMYRSIKILFLVPVDLVECDDVNILVWIETALMQTSNCSWTCGLWTQYL